jgi:hypothetical protein
LRYEEAATMVIATLIDRGTGCTIELSYASEGAMLCAAKLLLPPWEILSYRLLDPSA